MRDEDYALRMDFLAAAAGGRHKWLSELQGGRSNIGFALHEPVRAAAQQRWLWEGLSIGADAVLFWCWRDELSDKEFPVAADGSLTLQGAPWGFYVLHF